LAGEKTIAGLVRGAHLSPAWFLLRRTTLGGPLLQPLIASIAQALNCRRQADLAAREELEVVLAPLAYGRAEGLPTALVDHELGFLRMAPLLATVVAALFFCGRSSGLSVASSTITSNWGLRAQLLLAWKLKRGHFDENVLDSVPEATNRCFREIPRHGNMKIRAVFSPIL